MQSGATNQKTARTSIATVPDEEIRQKLGRYALLWHDYRRYRLEDNPVFLKERHQGETDVSRCREFHVG